MNIDPALPGADLVEQGLLDLRESQTTPEALLVVIAAPRLRRLGIEIPERALDQDAELELYELLGRSDTSDPFSAYNALLRRIVSFAAALEARRARHPAEARPSRKPNDAP